MTPEEYDKLSPEEREIKDKEDRAREQREQAGTQDCIYCSDCLLSRISIALPYTWKQQLGEVDIVVPIPKGTRARDLNVKILKKKLSVGLKGKEPILDGELCKEIKMDESTWTVGLFWVSLNPLTDFETFTTCRGPRTCSHSIGESEQSGMVGERAYPPSQDRYNKDRPREQQAKRLGW